MNEEPRDFRDRVSEISRHDLEDEALYWYLEARKFKSQQTTREVNNEC